MKAAASLKVQSLRSLREEMKAVVRGERRGYDYAFELVSGVLAALA